MNIKERTRKELDERVNRLEEIIAERGVGSSYLKRAERAQRDLNLAILLGLGSTVLGLTAYAIWKLSDD